MAVAVLASVHSLLVCCLAVIRVSNVSRNEKHVHEEKENHKSERELTTCPCSWVHECRLARACSSHRSCTASCNVCRRSLHRPCTSFPAL